MPGSTTPSMLREIVSHSSAERYETYDSITVRVRRLILVLYSSLVGTQPYSSPFDFIGGAVSRDVFTGTFSRAGLDERNLDRISVDVEKDLRDEDGRFRASDAGRRAPARAAHFPRRARRANGRRRRRRRRRPPTTSRRARSSDSSSRTSSSRLARSKKPIIVPTSPPLGVTTTTARDDAADRRCDPTAPTST